ncbi:MAG: ROK family protein [Anaerolineales bacterium]|nr:ROK family protein [Anaerolineales bacterium]
MNDWVVGIDLGATKIALGLINPQHQIVARRRIPTNVLEGPQAAVERMAQNVADLAQELPAGERIAAVGICSPGPLNHETGLIIDPPNLTGWRNVPMQQMLTDRLNVPVRLEHDAKASALGEYHYGVGRGERSMVYIVVGTGVGAAIIVDGQLYRGMHNSAGEVGHITINRNDEPGSSGVKGCVESYMSGPFLVQRYERLLRASNQQFPDQPLTGELIAHLAAKGDKSARQIMTQAGEALGVAIASLAMVLDIELYVIGSSVAKAGDLLLEPARQSMPHYCFQSVAATVRIVPASLGDDGPILGCGWLARQALL